MPTTTGMTFMEADRDMIKAHDIKLTAICTSVNKIEQDNKEFRSDMKEALDKIMSKLNESSVGCAENRADLMEKMNSKFVRSKVFWSVVGFLITGCGILLGLIKFL